MCASHARTNGIYEYDGVGWGFAFSTLQHVMKVYGVRARAANDAGRRSECFLWERHSGAHAKGAEYILSFARAALLYSSRWWRAHVHSQRARALVCVHVCV